jgi:hypothetical protein
MEAENVVFESKCTWLDAPFSPFVLQNTFVSFLFPLARVTQLKINLKVESTKSSAQSFAVSLLPPRLIPPGTVINTVALSPTGPNILICTSHDDADTFKSVLSDGPGYISMNLKISDFSTDTISAQMHNEILKSILEHQWRLWSQWLN